MSKRSAGLIMYRRHAAGYEVFLVHPGGPFWARKDLGAWSIPKGELDPEEPPLEAAKREFREETGFTPVGPFLDLGQAKQNSGKLVLAWAFEGDCDPEALTSLPCQIEWPPRSGRVLEFPEIDRGDWFSFDLAHGKLLSGQTIFLERLAAALQA